MFNNLPDNIRERMYLSFVLLIGLLRFINLGFIDMQAWDEALYAVRAEGILRFNGWLDQTSFAIDGLYSSLHPPVYVWLTAVVFKSFGISEFSARFISALMGVLTLTLIYRIGKKIANSEVGLLASVLFGLNPFVSFYSRQGQFDMTLVFFLAAAVYLLLKGESESPVKQSILAGVSIGAALMTKLYVGLGIPIAYAGYILFSKNTAKHLLWKQFAISTTAGIIVAAPWHIYMTILHGNGDPLFFLSASAFWERSVSGIEGNVKPLEAFYFVNQLFVLFPAGVIWFVSGLWSDIRERKAHWLLLVLWFAVFFVVFSLIRTKLAVYLLPMLVPASLIASRELWKATTGEISRKAFVLLFGGTLFSLLWASSQSWRNGVKDLLLLRNDSETLLSLLPFVILAATLVAISYIISKREVWAVAIQGWIIQLLIVPSVLLFTYHVFFIDPTEYNDGGKQLAVYVQQQGIDRIVVAGYERNPQLSYYLDGADIGWRDDLTFKRLLPPKDSTAFETWLLHETLNEPPTALLVLEKDKFIRYQIINPMTIIPPDYELVLSTRRYACFQRVTNNYLADSEK